MCGIVGFLSRDHFDALKSCLAASTQTLHHRGPDDDGLFLDAPNGVGMGHRRLAILDLSAAGHQPMADEHHRVRIAYNGEIYNFRRIRAELEALGHKFRGAGDTEVILKAYIQWGLRCFEKLAGMFALAIWDADHQRMVLARDPMGVKPLYYYHSDGLFIFSSELKAIMAFPLFKRTVDDDALALYLHYQYVPAPLTIFRQTHKLMPGSYLVLDGRGTTIERYWQLPRPDARLYGPRRSETAVLDHLDDLLTRIVGEQLVSDVPIGALLSGGVDSSLVAALMQKSSGAPVRTFSIGFQESGFNEAPWARAIASHLGTRHTELYVTSDQALDLVPRLPDIYDEPFADSSAVPTALVCRLTRTQVKVALSGDGGDEQYAGYVRYWMTQSAARLLSALPPRARTFLSQAMTTLPADWVARMYLPLRPYLPQRYQVANFGEKWRKLCEILAFGHLMELYRATICIWPREAVAALINREVPAGGFERAFEHIADMPVIDRLMWVDQQTYLPDAMLTKVDRASMAAGLEVRVPLLDPRAVSNAAAIPVDLKYRHGAGKYILKKLLSRYVPSSLFERPKMGFGVPIDHWLRTALKPLVTDYLAFDRIRAENRFDPKWVERTLRDHMEQGQNRHYRIWTLLMWEMWRERWLG